MAAFYSVTAKMVSWLGSLPHSSEWVANQDLADPNTWDSSALQTLKQIHDSLCQHPLSDLSRTSPRAFFHRLIDVTVLLRCSASASSSPQTSPRPLEPMSIDVTVVLRHSASASVRPPNSAKQQSSSRSTVTLHCSTQAIGAKVDQRDRGVQAQCLCQRPSSDLSRSLRVAEQSPCTMRRQVQAFQLVQKPSAVGEPLGELNSTGTAVINNNNHSSPAQQHLPFLLLCASSSTSGAEQ
jgi:hypothetical protein